MKPRPNAQTGGGLIEVLVAVLLVTVALVGMAALQAQSLRNMGSTSQRAAAIAAAASAFEFIRSDIATLPPGPINWSRYQLATTPITVSAYPSTPIGGWLSRYLLGGQHGLDPTTSVAITCTAGTCQITLTWNDSRGSGGAPSQQIQESARFVSM